MINGKFLFAIFSLVLFLVLVFIIVNMKRKENFYFEVSPMRKLGMLEGVLPMKRTPQDGVTCEAGYRGYNGVFPMNVGNWPYRADGYTIGEPKTIPPTESCGTGVCSNMCGDKDIQKMYQDNKFLPEFDKDLQKSMKTYITEQFTDSRQDVKDLDITMYYSDGCGHCSRAKEMLRNKGVLELINMIDADKAGLPAGVRGVPYFISRKTNKSVSGNPGDLDILISKLKDGQENSDNMNNLRNDFNRLKIKMYYKDQCGYCQQAKEMLMNNNLLDLVRLVDATKNELPQGVDGVPYFVSETTGKSLVGRPQNIVVLVKELDGEDNKDSGLKDVLKNLNITMYYSDNCMFCHKMKDALQEKGLLDAVKLVDVKDGGMPQDAQGVPHFVSEKTGKSASGYMEIEKLIDQLSLRENFSTSTTAIMPHFLREINMNSMNKNLENVTTKEDYVDYNRFDNNYYKYNDYSKTGAEVVSTLANCGQDKYYKGDFVYEGFEERSKDPTCYSGKCPLRNYSGKVDIMGV